jgi:hypothetical protein
MKNKKLLYILIPATLLLWGAIIYRIIGTVGNDESVNTMASSFVPMVDSLEVNDTFSIHPDYRDPFSGKSLKKVLPVSSENRVVAPKVPKINTPLVSVWPNVAYGGIIKNQKSNKQSVLVLINGQSNIMNVGDVNLGIQLLKVYGDSIEVKFNKEKKIVKK